MNILMFLEHLASNAHHRIAIKELVSDQPNEIKEAFLTNNVALLRKQIGDTEKLADKSAVVQIAV